MDDLFQEISDGDDIEYICMMLKGAHKKLKYKSIKGHKPK